MCIINIKNLELNKHKQLLNCNPCNSIRFYLSLTYGEYDISIKTGLYTIEYGENNIDNNDIHIYYIYTRYSEIYNLYMELKKIYHHYKFPNFPIGHWWEKLFNIEENINYRLNNMKNFIEFISKLPCVRNTKCLNEFLSYRNV